MPKTGTKEWATDNKNIYKGCKNNCLYCYARFSAKMYGRIKKDDEWKEMEFNLKRYNEKARYLGEHRRIMFPTTHDVFPETLDNVINYLEKWLAKGNDILIVSKPRLECIKAMCDKFKAYKKQIVFRFTIGSKYDKTLKFWEPDAPDYEERKKALKYAFEAGYETSVSCEPYLDKYIVELVEELLPYITNTIWVGKMNKIGSRVNTEGWSKKDFEYLDKVKKAQTNNMIFIIYHKLKKHKKVRWKDSMKKVLDLPEEAIG